MNKETKFIQKSNKEHLEKEVIREMIKTKEVKECRHCINFDGIASKCDCICHKPKEEPKRRTIKEIFEQAGEWKFDKPKEGVEDWADRIEREFVGTYSGDLKRIKEVFTDLLQEQKSKWEKERGSQLEFMEKMRTDIKEKTKQEILEGAGKIKKYREFNDSSNGAGGIYETEKGDLIYLEDIKKLIEEYNMKKNYIKKLEEHLDWAWAILANAGGGDWERETKDWQEAVKKWRNDYYKILDAQKEHKTDGTKCWCNPKIVKVNS